jgi:hypothetical protein
MRRILATIFGVSLSVAAGTAHGAELKPQTAEAFARYIRSAEERMNRELRGGGAFLWVDRQPEAERQKLYAQLRHGQILAERVEQRGDEPVEVPGGLVHDWVALCFIPGATLEQALAVLQDYDSHQNIYKPDVQRSKLLSRQGDDFQFYLQLYQKKIVSAVLNAQFEAHYARLGAARAYSLARSTRIAEVENPGEPGEHERPVGNDRGFLWRLNSYWRFAESDGGVYVQLESIALSRSVPAIFAWLVNPLLRSIPRDHLALLLNSTRSAVTDRRLQHTALR